MSLQFLLAVHNCGILTIFFRNISREIKVVTQKQKLTNDR